MVKERNIFEILSILDRANKPLISDRITGELHDLGIPLTGRMIRHYLQQLDGKGFTENLGRGGRIITESGRGELEKMFISTRSNLVMDKVARFATDTKFVISRNNFAFNELSFMRKLNQKKVKWIVREMERGKPSRLAAGVQGISQRRAQQLYRKYRDTGEIPPLKRCGRKKRELTEDERDIVLEAHKEYRVNALALERVIDRHYKTHIPHNCIHWVLKNNDKAKDEPHKQKQRKWVRYERKHSLSLVHVDWHEHKDMQVIAYLDDASRKILAIGEFDSANIENGLCILDQAIKEVEAYGPIRALLSDNGSEFSSHWKQKKKESRGEFHKHLDNYGIHHINTSPNHPQTNGKLEKWFDLYEKKRNEFDTLKGFIDWYNDKKPHMSLNFDNAETPSEAFTRKLRQEDIFHAAIKVFEW